MFMQGQKAFAGAAAAKTEAFTGAGAAGLVAGSLVETEGGWRPVEALRPGMLVATFDGGWRCLRRLARRILAAGTPLVLIPGGTLSACSDLLLLPGQPVLLPTGAAGGILEADHAFVPAAALVGRRGARILPAGEARVAVIPGFDEEEAIWVNSGVLLRAEGRGEEGFWPCLDLQAGAAMLDMDDPAAARRALFRAPRAAAA